MINFRLVNAAIICMFLFSLFSVGCDKDKSPTEPKIDLALVGTWEMTKIIWEYPGETSTYTESQLQEMGFFTTFEINNDGTFKQTTNMVDMSEVGPPEIYTGTWTTSTNHFEMTFTINGKTSTAIFEYSIDGNILTFINESPSGDMRIIMEYTKQ